MSIGKPSEVKDRIILALDTSDFEEAKSWVSELKDYVGYFKVGMQLVTASGMSVFNELHDMGVKTYCDFKFHDIPTTVSQSCENLIKEDINFFNIHLQGGSRMVKAATKTSRELAQKLGKENPTILGVTLLSSFGQRTLTEELCVDKGLEEYIMQLSQLAKTSGLDGVVAGASEAKKLREELGEDFIILCPATRPTWAAVNDQVRVDTPTEAIKAGIDYMVIGRPITDAVDKVAATKLILDEISLALSSKE
ncbi:MAG: orotidine-5'-phosphate decarboxylase [bacterium]|nr:orotidine-5'-phosphate decarboxylase [bacterium]